MGLIMIWLLSHYGPHGQQSTVIVRAPSESRARTVAAEMMHSHDWVHIWLNPSLSECLPLNPDDFECHFISKLAPQPQTTTCAPLRN